jgi:hypothetical protein
MGAFERITIVKSVTTFKSVLHYIKNSTTCAYMLTAWTSHKSWSKVMMFWLQVSAVDHQIKWIYIALRTSADISKCCTEKQPKIPNSKQCRCREARCGWSSPTSYCSHRLHCGRLYCQSIIRVFLFDPQGCDQRHDWNRNQLHVGFTVDSLYANKYDIWVSLSDCTISVCECVIWGLVPCLIWHYKENHISVWLLAAADAPPLTSPLNFYLQSCAFTLPLKRTHSHTDRLQEPWPIHHKCHISMVE